MLNGFKITGKLTIGFGIVLALFAVAVFLSWTSISAVQSDTQFLQRVADQMSLANTFGTTISLISGGIRDLKFSESDEDIAAIRKNMDILRDLQLFRASTTWKMF